MAEAELAGAWRARRTLSALQTARSSTAHSRPGTAVACAMKQIASKMMVDRECMVIGVLSAKKGYFEGDPRV